MSNEQLEQGGELIATPPGNPERQGKCRNFGPLMLCDAIFLRYDLPRSAMRGRRAAADRIGRAGD
jgi:hypothetical protein